MEIEQDQLTDHDKEMIKVAEESNPDVSEASKGPELPADFESVEDMIAWYNEQGAAGDEQEGEADETDEVDDESADVEDDAEEPELSAAEVELRELKAYAAVGGKEKYAEMTQWAASNMSAEHIDIYNAAVNGGDSNVAMLALQGLQAMHQLANLQQHGEQGAMTHPSTGGLNTTAGYATQSDMMAAMADKRYQTDESYVNQVMQKMALSSF